MSPDRLQELLRADGELVRVGPAPLGGIAARARRRRARLVVVAAVAALVVTAGGGVTLQQVTRTDANAVGEPVLLGPLEPPAGTRYVGLNGVVVAVPESWTIGAQGCGDPGVVKVPDSGLGDVRPCDEPGGPAPSSLIVYDFDRAYPLESGSLHPVEPVSEHNVVESDATCQRGACSQTFAVPDRHVMLEVTSTLTQASALRVIDGVRSTLRILPDEVVTVPLLIPGTQSPYILLAGGRGEDIIRLESAIRAAGLRFDFATYPTTRYQRGAFVDTVPAQGSPVAANGTVTIRLAVPPGPQVTVLDERGQQAPVARATLEALGLTVIVDPRNGYACLPPGKVLRQEPIASTKVDPGSAVRLIVTGDSRPGDCGFDVPPATRGLAAKGQNFVSFARGKRAAGHFAAQVSLYLGGQLVKKLSTADVNDRASWLSCPADGAGYAERSCPISALNLFVYDYPGPIVFSSEPPGATACGPAPAALPPSLDGLQSVTLEPNEDLTCFEHFHVQLIIDDAGSIVAVNAVLGSR